MDCLTKPSSVDGGSPGDRTQDSLLKRLIGAEGNTPDRAIYSGNSARRRPPTPIADHGNPRIDSRLTHAGSAWNLAPIVLAIFVLWLLLHRPLIVVVSAWLDRVTSVVGGPWA